MHFLIFSEHIRPSVPRFFGSKISFWCDCGGRTIIAIRGLYSLHKLCLKTLPIYLIQDDIECYFGATKIMWSPLNYLFHSFKTHPFFHGFFWSVTYALALFGWRMIRRAAAPNWSLFLETTTKKMALASCVRKCLSLMHDVR